MKKIERPNFVDTDVFQYGNRIGLDEAFHQWFTENVEPINEMLENAVKYYSVKPDGSCIWTINPYNENDRYQALLINIEPIKKETAEDVLLAIIEATEELESEGRTADSKAAAIIKRARAALNKD